MQIPTIISIIGVAATANAHMLLNKPTMFPNTGFATNDNGPLLNNGTSNYPCKYSGSGSYDFSFPRTQMPIGSNYSVQLKGDAVHGGGSCQMSLSKDLEPTAKSVFKVIHSVEGGCPARNTPGNLGGNAAAIDPFEYSFTIPDGIEAGKYTFAWTWFNKVGNREMYMNCAPIEVTGGTSKRGVIKSIQARDSSFYDGLPDMFLANIPDVTCASPAEGSNANMQFPDPGNSVERNVDASAMSPPKGTCYAPVGSTSSGSKSNSDSSDSSGSPGVSPVASSPAASAPAIIPSSAAPAPEVPVSSAPVVATPSAAVPVTASPVPASGSTSSAACSSGQMPCTGDDLVCIGDSQFGLCNNGCMIPQNVAAGTTCANGSILRRRARRYPPQARRAARAQT